jgi:hypothetical protein
MLLDPFTGWVRGGKAGNLKLLKPFRKNLLTCRDFWTVFHKLYIFFGKRPCCWTHFTGWVRGGQAGHGADLPAAQRGRRHHHQPSQSDQDRLPAVIGYSI